LPVRSPWRHLAPCLALLAAAPSAACAQPTDFTSSQHDYRVVKVVDGLINPWSMAFLPNGDMLVTERPGRLRIVRKGVLLPTSVPGTPEVAARGQGGLLDVALHPDFARNHFVYLSYSKPLTGGFTTTAVARAKFENDALTGLTDIFVADTKGTVGHFGSRLAFDKSGHLFVTVGDRMVPPTGDLEKHPAQDVSNHHGTVNRLMDDGRVPPDNPFVGKGNAKPEIWSYGHRNPQGLLVHPVTGDLWETEHGPQGGDELNRILPGRNYGWPVIGFGVNYGGARTPIHASSSREGMEQPMNVWVPSIATSGLMYYSGDKFPKWKGSLFVGGLAGEQIARVTLNGTKAMVADTLLQKQGRVRDVRQGPDGFIYVAIESQQGAPTAIVRLEPIAKR
jgi:glucose/arabinose dehydrogenase